ncbi:Aerotaxis receptor [Vibrio anguillarum 775]|nr:Aerotaxis receptor [Vibrio anguillarum 775]
MMVRIEIPNHQAVDAMHEGAQLSKLCVNSANVSGDKLNMLLTQVIDITDRNEQIATAVEEMARVTEDMNSSVQSISDVCVATNILASDTRDECEDLVVNLSSQGTLVRQFRRL